MIVAASGRHGQSHSHVTRPLMPYAPPPLEGIERDVRIRLGDVVNVVGHPSGDVAHGAREEPVEERDADIVGAASDAVPMRAAVASPGCTADIAGNAHPRSRPARLPAPGSGKCRETADPRTRPKPCGDFATGDGATVGGSRSAPVSACCAIGRPASCLVPSLFS